MSLSIQQSTEFSASSVQFSKLRKNKNGGKAVYLNAGDNKKLYIQFPFMRSPYGLSAFTDEGTGRTSYSLDLSFDPDNTEAMDLHEKLKELDDIIVNTIAENSKEWLGKEFNVAVSKRHSTNPWFAPVRNNTLQLSNSRSSPNPMVPLYQRHIRCRSNLSPSTPSRRDRSVWLSLTSIRFGSSITSSV